MAFVLIGLKGDLPSPVPTAAVAENRTCHAGQELKIAHNEEMTTIASDAVEKKLDMSLADIVDERKQLSPGSTSGKSRNSKRTDRIAQAGPYPQRLARGDDGDGLVGRRVYVGNLPWSVQHQDLKEHMATAGQVLYASVLESNGRSKGCGLVEYATVEDAVNAIETLTDTEIHGRMIFVREDREANKRPGPAPPAKKSGDVDEHRSPAHANTNNANTNNANTTSTRVYVGNLSWNVKWQDLKDHMKVAGTVKHADVLTESTGRSKGCGLVEYETPEEAARAIEMLSDTEIDGRKIFVREDREPEAGSISSIAHRAHGARPMKQAGLGRFPIVPAPMLANADMNSLYVGNLAWDVTWQALKDQFRSIGEVERVEIAQLPDGRSRGFGIVRFAHQDDAMRAIESFNGINFNGRNIEVRPDRPRA